MLWIIGIVAGVILLITLIVLCNTCYIVKQSEAVVIERFGRFHRILQSGCNFIAPCIDSPRMFPWQYTRMMPNGKIIEVMKNDYRIDLREAVFLFAPMDVFTKDTVLLEINTVMYYRICDVKKANYEVDDLQSALTAAAQTQLKEVFGLMAFHEALECQDFINDYLVREFSALFEKWGVEVLRMELIGLNTSDTHGAIAQTMKKQMIAERERRAKYIATEGEKAASLLIAEGVKKVAHIIGIAQQESTKKISEGHASATVVLAQAEKSSLDAITAITTKENVTLSDYFQTQSLLKAMRFKLPATLYLPFTLAPFSKLLYGSVPSSFGMPRGLRNRKNVKATTASLNAPNRVQSNFQSSAATSGAKKLEQPKTSDLFGAGFSQASISRPVDTKPTTGFETLPSYEKSSPVNEEDSTKSGVIMVNSPESNFDELE